MKSQVSQRPVGILGTLRFGFADNGADGTLIRMEWVTISKQFSPAEAELLRSRLEASGFLVSLKNLGAALAMDGYSLATGGIWVQVPEDQAVDARKLIDSSPEAADVE
jgi:hypothetical protein